jgi:hypothetical protein
VAGAVRRTLADVERFQGSANWPSLGAVCCPCSVASLPATIARWLSLSAGHVEERVGLRRRQRRELDAAGFSPRLPNAGMPAE